MAALLAKVAVHSGAVLRVVVLVQVVRAAVRVLKAKTVIKVRKSTMGSQLL